MRPRSRCGRACNSAAKQYAKSEMLPLLATLSPNAAILIFTVGVALIAVELNRPGSILPGAIGLLLTLLAAASLWPRHPNPAAVLQIIGSMAVLLVQVRRTVVWLVSAAATMLLIVSITKLLPSATEPRISLWTALVSGLVLGAGTTVLTRIARRARQNKGLD
jgi:membrane-bound ClpP family serine protease